MAYDPNSIFGQLIRGTVGNAGLALINSTVAAPSNPTTDSTPLWTDTLDSPAVNYTSGGGSTYVDHFFDVSPVDQAHIDATNRGLDIQQGGLDEQKAQDAFNNSLATSEFNWKKAQDTANTALAQGNLALAAQAQASADYWKGINAQMQQQQINLTNQGQQLDYASQMASIQQAREASNNNLRLGLANATNDADRNAITAKWYQEQAAIAKMQDETQRILGGQQNQTAQFNAETQRAGTMGNLALENNKFIADEANNPSHLWSLWFEQRGITPDWDTLAAGGTPATGQALVPVNPMTAYVPTTAAPTFNGTPQNQYVGQVGQAMASYSPQPNQYLSGGLPDISQPLDFRNGASFLPYQTVDLSGAPAAPDVSNYITQTNNVGGVHGGGVPLSSLVAGNHPYNVSGTTNGSSFTMPAYYDEGHTRPVQPNDVLQDGQQVYIDYQPPAMATGGMTRAPQFIVGDSMSGKPTGFEEMVYNPTNAPVKVVPIGAFGDFRSESVPRYAYGTQMPKVPRYAMGTDASAQYQATGLGDLWQPTSSNSYLDGQALPDRLAALGNAGVPLPPGVVAAATGQISPTLDMGKVFTSRGIGVAPSLQTINGMTKSEADNFKGYIQGVGGVPWDDFIDWLGTPTQNLQSAVRSRAA